MADTQISLTPRAAAHVRRYLAERDGETALGMTLRVGVKPTGCSGYQYVVAAADAVNDNDQCFEADGIKIVIDSQSLPYLVGTELDYVREGLNEGFRFNNPNVGETCGCGESFTLAQEAGQ